MDRFIETRLLRCTDLLCDLKSNMDRFIENLLRDKHITLVI